MRWSVFVWLRSGGLLLASVLLLCGRVEAQAGKPAEPYTLLNEVGRLASKLPAATVSAWKAQLHTSPLSAERAAHVHLWLGETELGQNEQPVRALRHFQQAEQFSKPSESVHTLATYDSAIALFYEGAYLQSANAFHRLLVSHAPMPGLDRRRCALWWRHAGACAGYHEERANLGIPEPRRLDPLCGVAALAACLRQRGLPSDKPALLAVTYVTGEGNSLQDIAMGARRLGAEARLVTADEKGLIALPKPLVAYVENDHFVAVVRADKRGVSYLCSDCGAWPGGRVDLTWKQWRKMDASLFLAVTKKHADSDRWLQAALTTSKTKHYSTRKLRSWTLADLGMKVPDPSTMQEHMVAYVGNGQPYCGTRPNALHCPSYVQCPMDNSGPCGSSGPSAGDPVNLATGEEEYTPAPDLTVYNPNGPSLVWGRVYNSLRGLDYGYNKDNYGSRQMYQYCDFGMGWSHTYNIGVVSTNDGFHPFAVLVPNGGNILFSSNNTTPTSANPTVVCKVPDGSGVYVTYNYDPTPGPSHLYFVITWPDRSQWITNDAVETYHGLYYPIKQMVDRMGNAITFHYDTRADDSQYEQYHFQLLTSITDKTGATLLTINHDTVTHTANNQTITYRPITSVTDCYGRSVYYHNSCFDGVNVAINFPQSYNLVDWVSQVVSTGTVNPPHRYDFGYSNLVNGEIYMGSQEQLPILTSISVPSPKNNGTSSTTTLHYKADGTCVVDYIQDANGNRRTYNIADMNHTTITVIDALNNVVYTYTAGFDGQMRQTGLTDGSNVAIAVSNYDSTSADPNHPISLVDGNGNTTYLLWDKFGNLHKTTSPRGLVTQYVWAFPPSTYSDVVVIDTKTVQKADAPPLGELISVQEGSKSPVSLTYYEPSGLVATIQSPKPGTVSDGTTFSTVTTSFTYDLGMGQPNLGNLLSVTTPGNNATLVNGVDQGITTTFNYTSDTVQGNTYSQNAALGQPVLITDNLGHYTHLRYYSPADTPANAGMLKSRMDNLGITTSYTYNIANQLQVVTLPVFSTTYPGYRPSSLTYSYLYPAGPALGIRLDANRNGVTQIGARAANFTYGAEGELTSVSGSVEPASYTYDGKYRLLTLTDGNNHVTTCHYNQAGYLDQVSDPNASGVYDTFSYTYDNAGHVITRTDGLNRTTIYTYNDTAFNHVSDRLTAITYPTAFSSLNVALHYDVYGRTVSRTDGAGSYTSSYDDLDAPLDIETTYLGLAGGARSVSYTYYPDGSRNSMTTPAGSFVYYRNAIGLMDHLINPNSETFQWTYLSNNWLASQQSGISAAHPSGACLATYTRDADGRLLSLVNTKTDMNQTLLSSFTGLLYDQGGSLSSVSVSEPAAPANFSGSIRFLYDSKNQLLQEQSTRVNGYTRNYGYDGAGNPTTFKGVTVPFNNDNQLSGTGYTYDGDGNPTSYKNTAFTFDIEDRLSTVGTGFAAGYTADGRRAWKQPSSTSSQYRTYFLYDGLAPVCEIISNGTLTAFNTFGPTGLLAREGGGFTSKFYTFDASGNQAQEIDPSGNVTTTSWFDAVGSFTWYGGNASPFLFGAKGGTWTDSETNFSWMGHRYYDAGTGKFITRDPIGYAGGINLYGYVGNNAVNRLDPSGLDGWEDNLAAFGGGCGDALSLGGTAWLRNQLGLSSTVNPCSSWYAGGQVVGGIALTLLTDGAGGELEGAGGGLEDALEAAETNCFPATMQAAYALPSVIDTPTDLQASEATPAPVTAQKSVAQIQVGDVLPTRNEQTGQTEYKRVSRTFQHTAYELVNVQIADARTGVVDTLSATPEHRVYVEGQGFVRLSAVGVGSQLQTRAGPPVVVKSVRWEAHPEGVAVYNFEVEDDHTYFVGKANGGIWVHNDCGLRRGSVDIDNLKHYIWDAPTGDSFDVMLDAEANGSTLTINEGHIMPHTGDFEDTMNSLGYRGLMQLKRDVGAYFGSDTICIPKALERTSGKIGSFGPGTFRVR